MNEEIETSIIIPNYNGSKYIRKCLNSIEEQEYKKYEVIIIDDGSTDDSAEIIKEFMENSNMRIIFIEQFNQNAAIARNRGLEIAKGKYLYFIDSDDELYDNKSLEIITREISDNDLLIGGYISIDEKENIISNYDNKEEFISENDDIYKYANLSPMPSNKLYKTEIVKKNELYFGNVKIGQDLNFYLKYLQFCKKVKLINKNIYKYRIVSNSMTRIINLNFLDIYNTFLDIKKCYEKNNNITNFKLFVTPVAIRHFQQQLIKVDKIREKEKRKMIFEYFKFCYKDIQVEKKYRTKQNKIQIKKFWAKYFLLKYKLYKSVMKIRKGL